MPPAAAAFRGADAGQPQDAAVVGHGEESGAAIGVEAGLAKEIGSAAPAVHAEGPEAFVAFDGAQRQGSVEPVPGQRLPPQAGLEFLPVGDRA